MNTDNVPVPPDNGTGEQAPIRFTDARDAVLQMLDAAGLMPTPGRLRKAIAAYMECSNAQRAVFRIFMTGNQRYTKGYGGRPRARQAICIGADSATGFYIMAEWTLPPVTGGQNAV